MQPMIMHLQTLLGEYDGVVTNLKQEIDRFKIEHEELKQYILQLVEDNKRLNDELKENVQTRIVATSRGDVEKELQHQLEMANEAKDMVLEMWQLALQEIDRLENVDRLKSNLCSPDNQLLQAKAAELKQEYSKALEIMNKELVSSKDELRVAKFDLTTVRHEHERLKQLTIQLEEKIVQKEKETSTAEKKISQMQPRILELEADLASMQISLAQMQQKLNEEKEGAKVLQQTIASLKTYRSELESREADAIQKAKESIQLAESAILEKDGALFREQRTVAELKGLQESMDGIVELAAQRAREEINNMKAKSNESIKQLLEEVQALEKENNEKQALIERAVREKRAAESELTTLYNEGYQKDPQDTPLFRDISLRLNQIERDRDDAKARAESLQSKLLSVENCHQQEVAFLKSESKQLKETLGQVQNSFSASNEERLRLAEKAQDLSQSCQMSNEENTILRRTLQQEVSRLETVVLQQQEEHMRQLQEAQTKHQSSILELRNLVDAQQNMTGKWKDEVRTISERFEKEIKELNRQLLLSKDANGKLSTAFGDVQQRASLAEKQKNTFALEVTELKRRISELNKETGGD